jgi:hypothetical protein
MRVVLPWGNLPAAFVPPHNLATHPNVRTEGVGLLLLHPAFETQDFNRPNPRKNASWADTHGG